MKSNIPLSCGKPTVRCRSKHRRKKRSTYIQEFYKYF